MSGSNGKLRAFSASSFQAMKQAPIQVFRRSNLGMKKPKHTWTLTWANIIYIYIS